MSDYLTNTQHDSLQYLYVKNWQRWQTYRHDRGLPPWIKVHRRLMRNPNWVALTDAQKGQLVCIWMLAADQNGRVPSCPKLIKRLCCLETEPDLTMLISQGFLDAKMTPRRLSTRRQLVTPKAEAEAKAKAEADIDIDSASPTAQPVKDSKQEKEGKGTSDKSRGTRLPEGWLPSPEVHLFAVGLLGESGVISELERFRDYWIGRAGAGARKADWDRTFRNWCRTAKDRKGGGNGGFRPQTLKERTADALQRLGSSDMREIIDFGLPQLSNK